ncbi:MAG: RDD family protein [Rhodothermales bacterium]|nr:RDD family protein [Rhodothermales bacterium]
MEPHIDPRRHVTPEAFRIDPAVLGLPLATPKRRALALLIDLGLAAVLAQLGGVLVGFAVAIVFFRIATRRVDGNPLRRAARIGFSVAGSVLIFATALILVEVGRDPDDGEAPFSGLGAQYWAPGASMDYAEFAAATGDVDADSAEVMEAVVELMEDLDLPGEVLAALEAEAEPDTLSAEERAAAAARVRAYADAYARADSAALDSLGEAAATVVAAPRIRRLRRQIRTQEARLETLEEDNERLAEEAAHPGLLRIAKALADDVGITVGWVGLYFTLFLVLWDGRTPAKRLLGLRVVRLDGQPLTLWVAFERFGGYAAGIATGLLGFFQVYWDDNRQAIQDRIAGTVVVRDG